MHSMFLLWRGARQLIGVTCDCCYLGPRGWLNVIRE
jgi:hypothetical protein